MDRVEFMRQLESLLQNISQGERQEAMQYYNDYFDDAGVENEQSVIEALGTPARVAENIKRDLYGSGYGDAVFQKEIPGDKAMVEYHGKGYDNQNAEGADGSEQYKSRISQDIKSKDNKLPAAVVVLIAIACVLASPAILGVVSGVLGVLFGIIVTWFCLILAFGIVTIALIFVMFVLAVVGIMCMTTDGMTGIFMLGGGLVCGGVGILFLMLTVAMTGIVTPAMFRGIEKFFRFIAQKVKEA